MSIDDLNDQQFKDLEKLVSFEARGFEEFYEYGWEWWKLDDLDKDYKDIATKLVRKLLDSGLTIHNIKSLVHTLNETFKTDIIEGLYWFVEIEWSPVAATSKKQKTKVKFHENFGWTIDIINDVDKLLKAKKLKTFEHSYKSAVHRGDHIDELDDSVKNTIAKYLRGSKSKKTRRKKQGKSTKTRRKKQGKSTKSRNKNIKVYYFFMDGCHYCKEFNKTWSTLKKKYPNATYYKHNKDSKPNMILKYGIETYPAIVRVSGTKHKVYPTDDRELSKLLKFIRG
tara:strand:- start:166 stop:1011 length:846 start_codon:yes stop_codon:yes gene_type:complete